MNVSSVASHAAPAAHAAPKAPPVPVKHEVKAEPAPAPSSGHKVDIKA